MSTNGIGWKWAFGAYIAAEVILVGAAVAWVAIYSHLINPGAPVALYREYAQQASPYVSLLLGPLVLVPLCRWAGRRSGNTMSTALAVFGIWCAIDVPLMLLVPNPSITPWFAVANFASKLAACMWGGAAGQRRGMASA